MSETSKLMKVKRINRYASLSENKRIYVFPLTLLFLCAILVASTVAAIAFGAKPISMNQVIEAFVNFDATIANHQVVMTIRLPRALAAIATGVGFAISGAIIQGISRNPLADSGILGLNAGAGFMLVVAMIFIPTLSFQGTLWLCVAGAALSAALVFGVGVFARKGLTPLRLVLTGAAIAALLTALTEGLSIFFGVTQQVAFWYGGGLSGISLVHLQQMLPWMLAALAVAMIMGKSITLLNLGSEAAQGLGVHVRRTTIISLIAAFVLAGIACALAGSVSFVGLLAPHLARLIIGTDYRYIVPVSALLGANLVILSDLAARVINAPYEIPVGAIIAVIGIPFFLLLAKKERRGL